jgi:two-component system, cell cycle sensor histidine kinase and response regulator CckA
MPVVTDRLAAALNGLSRAVAILRVSDWTIVYANDACERMYATSAGPRGIVGKPFMASQPTSGVENFQDVILAQFDAGRVPAVYESERVRADGQIVHVQVTVTPLADPSDGAAWVAVIEDITKQKHDERELAELNRKLGEALAGSEQRFRAINDAGVIGVVIGTGSGETLEVNEACAKMLGYARDEYLSHHISFNQITPAEWMPATLEGRRQLAEKGYAEPFRKDFFHKNGGRVPVLVTAVRLDGDHSIGLVMDLSEQQRTEQALRATEEQLRQAQKMEAVGRLAGGVAHDFNNLLSVVLSAAQMLQEESPNDERVRGDAQLIYDAARRGANLTKQLLLFSRQEVAEARVLDLNRVLVSIEDMLRRLVGEDIEIELSCDRSCPRLRADPGHVEQVLMNLVVNARDAMPAGGTIRIGTSSVSAHGAGEARRVILTVADTGSGMDEATRSHIFEPFFTTKEKGKGTGLGLSTVFGIVHDAGGTICVDTRLGSGTTFTIELPAANEENEEEANEPESVPRLAGETVLLVEDEQQVRRVARRILEGAGYRVLEAADPVEALALFERASAPVDLIITDVVMPKMNGVELIRRLRERSNSLRALCMSGYTEDETARSGLQELRVPMLQKPFTPESLRRKVREALALPIRGKTLHPARGLPTA